MGGVGSGTWKRQNTKRMVEHALALEISRCREMLHFPGSGKLVHCSPSGEATFIAFQSTCKEGRRTLTLNYCDRMGEQIQTTILLESTPLHFGGERWWFTCPMVKEESVCNRRVGKLYVPPGERTFGCRTCHELAYHSSQTAHLLERYHSQAAREKRLEEYRRIFREYY